MRRYLIACFLFAAPLFADDSFEEMLYALEVASGIDGRATCYFPLTFNHLLSTGYFATHSARMSEEGEFGFGVAHAPPYLNVNARLQPFRFLELTANLRVFRGCEDVNLSKYGYGDFTDRGANFKIGVVAPEQSSYRWPGFAVGIDDFMGTKRFRTYYLVGTQVWPEMGLEASLGWGAGRYTHGPTHGFFGGLNWFPYGHKFCLTAEVDPTNYKEREPHPGGQTSRFPLNLGAKYRLAKLVELSASYIRGEAFAFAGSIHYNWGKSRGLLPKVKDPLPHRAPVNKEPLSGKRPKEVMIQEMSYAFEAQGFKITQAWIDGSGLWLQIINDRYRQEEAVRMRLQHLLTSLLPSDIEQVVVILESYGLVCQQYVYRAEWLERCSSPFAFALLTAPGEACLAPPGELIFQRRYDLWRRRLSPRLENFFGSASGKYKYDLGIKLDLEGFLPGQWFYEVQLSTTVVSDLSSVSDFDLLHPSQLPNVATDYIRYRQSHALTWDRLYLQKSWNLTHGAFARLAGGYFQVNYAGLAAETLWYPARSYWAVGLEGATVKKRRYTGLGFQSKLRRFEGSTPIFFSYNMLQQYFLSLYFDIPDFQVFAKLSGGQFLAGDIGAKLEATRYFHNGVRITGWLTCTNAKDQMHGVNYFDRGIAFEIPLDFFYQCSSRRVWNYAMAAWLRDAGYSIWTGRSLFEILSNERRR